MPGFDAVFLRWLLLSSASATAIAGVVMIVQIVFGRWLTPAGRQRLWLLVIVRLLLPILPASAMSVANLRIENILTTRHAEIPVLSPAKDRSGFVTTIRIKPISTDLIPSVSMPVATEIAPPRSWTDVVPGIALALWAAVALAIFLRLLWVNRTLSIRLRRAPPVTDSATLDLLLKCLAIAGVRSDVRMVVTDAVTTPAVHGIFRPRILMPAGLLESLTLTQQRHIVLHELSHIRHQDVLANWMLALLSVLHWFNPLLWIAFARLKADRELARDAWVIRRSGTSDSADNYAETLVDLAQRLSASRSLNWPQVAAPLPGLFGRKTSLRRRLQMIAHQSDGRRGSQIIGLILLAVIAAGTLTHARAQTAAQPASPDSTKNSEPTTAPSSRSREIADAIRRDLKIQAQQHIKEGKYSAALDSAKRILAIDPKDDYAGGILPLLEDKVAYDKEHRAATSQPKPEEIAAKKKAADAASVVQQLNRVLPTVQFDAVGFNDVIDFMRDVSGANLFVNWKVLEAAGIHRDMPVTANVHNVSFARALDLILESVGGQAVRLGYTVDEGVITISTRNDLQKNVVIRVYDVRDLLEASTSDPAVKAGDTRTPRDRKIAELIKLIEDTVDSESWKDRGGEVASLRLFDPSGQLIVTQTPDNHRSLVEVLDRLRARHGVQILLEGEYYDCDSAQLAAEMKKWWIPLALKPPTAKEAESGIVLAPNQVEQHLAEFKASGKATLLASPRFMLLDGQQALVQTSMKHTYIGDYMAVHGADGQMRYEPVQRTVEPGVEIEAQATVDEAQKVVRLSIHPKITTLAGMKSKAWPGRPENLSLVVETPELNVSEAQVSAMVPSEQTLVVVVAQQERGRSLLILVKPTISRQPIEPMKPPVDLKTNRQDGPQGLFVPTAVDLSSHYPWMKN